MECGSAGQGSVSTALPWRDTPPHSLLLPFACRALSASARHLLSPTPPPSSPSCWLTVGPPNPASQTKCRRNPRCVTLMSISSRPVFKLGNGFNGPDLNPTQPNTGDVAGLLCGPSGLHTSAPEQKITVTEQESNHLLHFHSSIHPSFLSFIHPSILPFIHPSILSPIHPPTHSFFHSFIHLSSYSSILQSVLPCINLSIHPSTQLSFRSSILASIYPSSHLSI